MSTHQYVYWQDGEQWLGYPVEFPDYWTQGTSRDDLEEHLRDLLLDLRNEAVPGVRRVAELTLP